MNTTLRTAILSLLGLAPGLILAAEPLGLYVGGAGAQVKLGPFALRGEYERFDAAGAHPSLWTIGATWTFL